MFIKLDSPGHIMRSDISSSAFRIYLTNLLQQTKDILQTCKLQCSICTLKHVWELAVDAASAAIASIRDYQQSLLDDVGAFSVIESWQDALCEALHRARIGDLNDDHYHGRLSDAHATRAIFLTNGFTARRDNDLELSSLWFLAAKVLQSKLELTLEPASLKPHYAKAKIYLTAADAADRNREQLTLASQISLSERVCHHYRYAAVLSALGRPNSHDYAAELYEKALDARRTVINMHDSAYHDRNDPSTPGKLVLLESAAAAWQLAAEMAVAQASNSSTLRHDPAILDIASAATMHAGGATKVASLLEAVRDQKAAAIATKESLALCKDAILLPLWRELATKQDEAVVEVESCFQSFINGEIHANKAERAISDTIAKVRVAADRLHKLQVCSTRTEYYYTQRAVQALQGARSLPLTHKCWTQAVVYMQQVTETYLAEGDSTTEQAKAQRFWLSLADHSVNIAEHVLGSAVEYLDKARGAEAGEKSGRDPREAQMWRKAAKCLLEKAELMWAEMLAWEKQFDPSRGASALQDSPHVKDTANITKVYIQAAKYFYMAFKHRALPDADSRQNGTQVAVLYERAAELVPLQVGAEQPGVVVRIVDQHVAFMKMLNEFATVPQDVIATRHLICKYGWLACTHPDPVIREYWGKANELLERMLAQELFQEGSLTGHVAASLFACAASEDDVLRRIYLAAAARYFERAYRPDGQWSSRLASYCTTMAAVILTLGDVSSALPAEVTTFLEQVQQQSTEVEKISKLIEEHAPYEMLWCRCAYQVETLGGSYAQYEAWETAQRKLDTLLDLLRERAEGAIVRNQVGLVRSSVIFYSLVVKCHVALAEAEPGSDRAAAWKKVVNVCQKEEENGHSYEDCLIVVESALQAAQVELTENVFEKQQQNCV